MPRMTVRGLMIAVLLIAGWCRCVGPFAPDQGLEQFATALFVIGLSIFQIPAFVLRIVFRLDDARLDR